MGEGVAKVIKEPGSFQMLIIISLKHRRCHYSRDRDRQGKHSGECAVSQWAMNVLETISGVTFVEI